MCGRRRHWLTEVINRLRSWVLCPRWTLPPVCKYPLNLSAVKAPFIFTSHATRHLQPRTYVRPCPQQPVTSSLSRCPSSAIRPSALLLSVHLLGLNGLPLRLLGLYSFTLSTKTESSRALLLSVQLFRHYS